MAVLYDKFTLLQEIKVDIILAWQKFTRWLINAHDEETY